MERLWTALTRRKRNNHDDHMTSELARVLSLLDLTGLGVGATLGLGVYVLAGSVAYEQAGPGVVLSFLIAAIASAFAALCYAEFAARVPKAGSAYVYSYVSVGEMAAFTIGWNLILEYVIGTASVARGMSGYIDALLDHRMSRTLNETMGIRVEFLAEYPDFLSFGAIILLAILLGYGVKESSTINNVFTALNLVVIAVVIVTGIIYAKIENWSIAPEDIPPGIDGGKGGFLPYGLTGVMAGAAKCFYGFVGFDTIATTGEEAKNPQRNIPLAIVISLVIIFFAYFGISTVLTMMWPYYDQDPNAPFPYVFDAIGLPVIKWIVTVGAVFALSTALLGAMFPLPRVLYAMSSDGIIYKFLSKVNPKTQTPMLATILAGFLAAFMALIFDLQQLIDMMSIGTLLAYTIVAICVLILRYHESNPIPGQHTDAPCSTVVKQILNLNFIKQPNSITSTITKWAILIYSLLCCVLCGLVVHVVKEIPIDSFEMITSLVIVVAGLLLMILIIARQPNDNIKLTFKVPLVPILPCISVLINLYLMFQLDVNTWIRFGVWLAIGYFIYFTYGIRNAQEGILRKNEKRMKNDVTKFDHNGISVISIMSMPDEKSSKKSYNLS